MKKNIEIVHPGNKQIIEVSRCGVDSIKYRKRKTLSIPQGEQQISDVLPPDFLRDDSSLKLHINPVLKTDIAEGKDLLLFPSLPYWLIGNKDTTEAVQLVEQGVSYGDLKETVADADHLTALLYARSVLSIDGQTQKMDYLRAPHLAMSDNTALLSLTLRCNLNCPHCVASANEDVVPKKEMSTQEAISLIDQIEQIRGEQEPGNGASRVESKVFLSGGEPFVRRDIMDIIRHACQKRLTINVCTNALLITDAQVAEFADLPVSFSVSVDGAQAETHEQIRGKGTFARTTKAIEKLTQSGKDVYINTFLHDGNFDQMEGLLWLAHNIGVRGINFIDLIPRGRGHRIKYRAIPQPVAFRRLYELAGQNKELYPLIRNENSLPHLFSSVASGVRSHSCGTGRENYFYVSYMGDVYPCPGMNFPEYRLGNIKEAPLDAIINQSPVRQSLGNWHVDYMNSTCPRCEFRYFCGGDCRGNTYRLTGDINAPSPYCEDIKQNFMLLFKLIAENPTMFQEKTDEFVSSARQQL